LDACRIHICTKTQRNQEKQHIWFMSLASPFCLRHVLGDFSEQRNVDMNVGEEASAKRREGTGSGRAGMEAAGR